MAVTEAEAGVTRSPTFVGIHARDERAQVLYISSGIRDAMGFKPEDLVGKPGHEFIADASSRDYPSIYTDEKKDVETAHAEEEEDEDEANAYVMYMNIKTASGTPVLMRVTSFKCDNCVIFVGVAFPGVPFMDRHELEVQMLDGAMKSLNITRAKGANSAHAKQAAGNARTSMYFARSKQIKAAFVLENPNLPEKTTDEAARRPTGPLIAFVTGSVSRLVDADPSDLSNYPFMKLVAPEDVLHVGKFFDRLADATDVLFETFALLQRPHVIDGDVVVADADNRRVVVECLGAAVQDGVALLLRRLRTEKAPTRDSLGNYLRADLKGEEKDCLSLFELVSSDPETSDAPVWSLLN
ncbi:hypothetical protein GGF46_001395 [Coemansia sp. RSA 552]|nr:hypothetical protein GGF46_001395 [Coemansia sp. RSA 552]